jgi:hypothetical protein
MIESLHNHARGEKTHMANRPPYPGTPRWVKVFGIIVIILVLLFGGLKLFGVGGEHGPGRHAPSGDAGGQAPPSGVLGDRAPPEGGRG